ncbi:putative bifunctional diguanylate cyclase/phosphodiesterase [Cryptosporangium phraense]|uniref:EAL domain-containing protein n=1 Tax=Cryptosporangium phraense TaxID=2593070 RepID=A0A545ARR3_9ACTN|nr:bifunctional diguanylate cyclase/phosphodiesterase [Cryptosporangium phraense]TQS44020.1 EAL domain-containing protein [Cryptosporangium phraense]
MPDVEHPPDGRWPLRAAGVLVAVNVAWVTTGLFHVWTRPLAGWIALPVTTLLAGYACWRLADHPTLDAATRRFWRQLTLACGLFTAATLSNAVDALGSGTPSQRLGPITLALYLAVLGLALWALLRLPPWQRTRADWIRFGLDACMVLVTVAALVWHFSIRNHDDWATETGSGGAMLAILVLTWLSVATFVKVAFAGAGCLDRRALHALAAGTAISAVVGALAPLLISRPYLSTSMVAAPVAAFGIHLAAVRQRQADPLAAAPRRPSPRVSLLPYLAVAAAAAVLLATGTTDPVETTIMQVVTVTLTLVVVARQVLALRDNNRLLATVEYQATHDGLTGIANRALLERHLDGLLAAQRRFHLVLLDVDDFKTVNDRLGHSVGDALLTVLSTRLTDVVGGHGLVARLGGDEFAIAVPEDADGAPDVEALVARVLAATREPVEVAEQTVLSGTSIGLATSRTGDDPPELLRRADVAMYAAKAAGGGRRHWFDPALDRAADETAHLSADLRRALAQEEMLVLFQPIVDLRTEATVGAEVLVRWQHPERGLVSPDVFVPLAERNGVIVELGYWVLEHACRHAAAWQVRYGDRAPTKISINVSARQLAQPDFVERVEKVVRETTVDARALVLEVTETAVFSTDVAIPQLTALRKLGLKVALDDFGTGHSSLSLLIDCPVDVLKVDKSFVSGPTADGAGAIITRNLIGFVNDFGIEAVAEGIETRVQAAWLRRAGYRLGQGYLFGCPMPAADLERRFAPPKED